METEPYEVIKLRKITDLVVYYEENRLVFVKMIGTVSI